LSYCVNCGVELAESEKSCPLCGVEVFNPLSPYNPRAPRPYPKRIERLAARADRLYLMTIAALLMLIPLFVTVLCDMLYSGGMTWSLYVAGAMAMVGVYVVVPLAMKRPTPVVCIPCDTAATALYLWLLEYLAGGRWFLPVALPETLIAGALLAGLALLFRGGRYAFLERLALVLFASGVFCALTELIVRAYNGVELSFSWSLYVLAPCVVLWIAAMVLERRLRLKERLKRRFFV